MKHYFIVAIGIILVVVTHSLRPEVRAQEKIYQALPKEIANFTLGYNDLAGSLIWIRTLQDIDVCEQKREIIGERTAFVANIDPVKQVLEKELPTAKCHLGWVYKMVDLCTEVFPIFKFAFRVGGTFLSVLVDDREGASRIFTKATAYFPDDWQILYAAAYHELFEMQRPKKAAILMEKAARRGAPWWVYSLSARLYTEVGQAEFAKTILESVLARNPQGHYVYRLHERLKEINGILKKNKSTNK